LEYNYENLHRLQKESSKTPIQSLYTLNVNADITFEDITRTFIASSMNNHLLEVNMKISCVTNDQE